MILHSPFLILLEKLPSDHIVCEHNGAEISAGKLKNESIAMALWLRRYDISRGDRVLMACASGIEFLTLFYALLHIRAKIALVDPHMGRQLYHAKVQQFQPMWAFIDSRILMLQEHPILRYFYFKRKNPFYLPYSKSYKIFATGITLPLFQRHKKLPKKWDIDNNCKIQTDDNDDELVIVYTSGTLSEPKAVVHTVNSLYYSLTTIASLFEHGAHGSIFTHLPQFAMIGMINGFRVHFWKGSLSPQKKIRLIERKHITTLFGPPAEYFELMQYCEKSGIRFPPNLSHLLIGSASVLKPFLTEVRRYTDAKITCLYGMTENLVVASVDGDQKLAYQGSGDLLGMPHSGVNTQVSEDHELLIHSPMLYKRYYHLDSRPFFHKTGDLMRMDKEGRLVMLGRKKNMIIRKNKNIYPGLYEDTICAIPGVRDAVMRGYYDEAIHDERVALVVEGSSKLTEKAILEILKVGKYRIDSDVLPDHILLMPIPRSGRQRKVNQQKLNDLIKEKLSKVTTS